MKILTVADALSTIKPARDTGIAFASEAFNRGYQCFWTTPEELLVENGQVKAYAQQVIKATVSTLPQVEAKQLLDVSSCDAVFVRKDPPFDSEYLSMCWLLSALESHTVISNKPSLLMQHHEKWLPLQAVSRGYLSEDEWIAPNIFFAIETFIAWYEHTKPVNTKSWIIKPWRGHGGGGVLKANSADELFAMMHKLPDIAEGWIVQRYHEQVETTGDRRVFYLDGKIQGSFVRRAQQGDFVTNMAQGGFVESVPMSKNETDLCDKVARFLKDVGIDFAGLDIIDGRLNEVNITAPTGILALKEFTGMDLANEYLNMIEREVKRTPLKFGLL
jgi:glutathione synthase